MEIQWSFFVTMIQTLGNAIYKRAVEHGDKISQYELPPWTILVVVLNLIVFLPAILVLEYTFKQVYPVLAIVEDENPPAYEPVSLNDDDARSLPEATDGVKPTDGRTQTVTSSFRAINRLLRANGGWKANFRGLACLIAQSMFSLFLMGIFSAVLGGVATPIATLLASLTLVQYSTAWVHIVVSERSELHFWRRLPPFKRTFEATWKPVTLFWFASEVHRWVPEVLGPLLNMNLPKFSFSNPMPDMDVDPEDNSIIWKSVVVMVVSIAVSVLLVLPAEVILVRVQASLLPVEQETIIPFDRSFEGRIEPAVVGGRGHATISDAWKTFTLAAWRRLVLLQIKIFAVVIAGTIAITLLLAPQFILIARGSKKVDGGNDL